MTKFFNRAGPIKADIHYALPLRLNVEKFFELFREEAYFILHAPRQSGKTSAILALIEKINTTGEFLPLYVNVESAQVARGDVTKGIATILSRFSSAIYLQYGADHPALKLFDSITKNPLDALHDFLQKWSLLSNKPIILFIDEIDALIGDTLISVLRQLRTGYPDRPKAFPQSVCLIGVRDVRDYKIFSEEKQAMVLGGSAFNIKADSLTLPNFSEDEVHALYLQHTQATGQRFSEDAIKYAYEQTQGQPWLINALAYQACTNVRDRTQPITEDVLRNAREELIIRRDTHLDVLLDRLKEARVAHIIDAIIAGQRRLGLFPADDLKYATDLGLVSMCNNELKIANPIYQEIIPRELTLGTVKKEKKQKRSAHQR